MRSSALPLWMVFALVVCAGCSDGRGVPPTATRSPDPVRLEVGSVGVDARLAMTQVQRARGLSGVAALQPNEGMLFVYRDEQPRQFWMRDCLVALDVAFLDGSGRVLQVDTMQPPQTADEGVPRTRRSGPSSYVLELPAGFFERHGLGVGTHVRIPARVRRADAE